MAYGPDWIMEELEKIWPEFAGKKFKLIDKDNKVIDTLTVPTKPSLEFLQLLARNEPINCDGSIRKEYYNNFNGISRKAVLILKDLVRHTLLIAKVRFVAEGGYHSKVVKYEKPKEAFVIDLSGPQFQHEQNYGRNLFIPETPYPADQEISGVYERLTGHKPPSFAHIKQQIALANPAYTGRYEYASWKRYNGYFDYYAYKQMVGQDFYLSARAIQDLAKPENKEIDFRFLAYGTGFFGDAFKHQLVASIRWRTGWLEKLAADNFFPSQIKRLTFPKYPKHTPEQENIKFEHFARSMVWNVNLRTEMLYIRSLIRIRS